MIPVYLILLFITFSNNKKRQKRDGYKKRGTIICFQGIAAEGTEGTFAWHFSTLVILTAWVDSDRGDTLFFENEQAWLWAGE